MTAVVGLSRTARLQLQFSQHGGGVESTGAAGVERPAPDGRRAAAGRATPLHRRVDPFSPDPSLRSASESGWNPDPDSDSDLASDAAASRFLCNSRSSCRSCHANSQKSPHVS